MFKIIKKADEINLIVLFFFLFAAGIMDLFLKAVNYSPIVYMLKVFGQYIAGIFAIIIIFNIFEGFKIWKRLKIYLPRVTGMLEKSCRIDRLPVKIHRNFKEERYSRELPPQGERAGGETEPEGDLAESVGSELHAISEARPDSTDGPERARLHRKAEILNNAAYILLQAGIAYIFLRGLFTSLSDSPRETYGYFQISGMIILAMAAFVIRKFALTGKKRRANHTAAGYCAAFGCLCFISAFFLVVRAMLAFDTCKWLIFFFRGAGVYIVLSLGLGILLSLFERGLHARKNYLIYIPFINRTVHNKNFIELLEKNTNISVKSLWSIRYVSAIFPGVIVSIVFLILLSTCVYVIEPYQEGAVYHLGRLREASIAEPGFHVKLPWPIDKLEVYDVQREKSLQIGYKGSSSGDFLWTSSHEGGEYTLLLGNGNELVAINAKLTYRIEDLYAYLLNYKEPENLLSAAAYEILMRKTVTTTLDNFLREDRSRLAETVKDDLNSYCHEQKLGIEIKNIAIQSIHPVVEVADAYQEVVGAGIQKQSLITEAQAEENKLIAEAEKEKEYAIISAQQNQTEKTAEANYEMAVYRAACEAYEINPESFRLDKYLNTCEKIISGHKVYVFSPNVGKDLSNYIINNSKGQTVVVQ
ncbi:MAG TPA: protease modulator HflK [Bacillota bacterium]|nr:protease modulator HflK [Bacillota bacterium]